MSIVDSLRGKELEDYVYEKYGIINDTGMGYWMIPDAWGNTSEEQYEIWDMIEWVKDEDLEINDGDIIAVWRCINDTMKLFNITNDTYGFLKIRYSGELWDDDRFALINEITDMYKKYKDVTFQMYLLYTEEQMMNYVRAIEKEDEEFNEYIKNKKDGVEV